MFTVKATRQDQGSRKSSVKEESVAHTTPQTQHPQPVLTQDKLE
jgi:hypothetical protein